MTSTTCARTGRLRSSQGPRGRSGRRQDRVGAAAVEFAVVAPLMFLLTMGMIEVGRMVMVKQLMVNASREGARLGTLPGIAIEDVTARVEQELASASLTGVAINVSPITLATAPAGTPVTVSLSAPSSQVSWLPQPLFKYSTNIEASTTMRRESH